VLTDIIPDYTILETDSDVPDQLIVLDIRYSSAVFDIDNFVYAMKGMLIVWSRPMLQEVVSKHTSHICGPSKTLENVTFHNLTITPEITDDILTLKMKGVKRLSDSLGLSSALQPYTSDYLYIWFATRIRLSGIRCTYERVQFLDASHVGSPVVVEALMLFGKASSFPELLHLNVSHMNLTSSVLTVEDVINIAPRVKYLDASHNIINYVSFNSERLSRIAVYDANINLRHNNITAITVDDVNNLGRMLTVFFDIRDNPLECTVMHNLEIL
jgi:hypothetical protein